MLSKYKIPSFIILSICFFASCKTSQVSTTTNVIKAPIDSTSALVSKQENPDSTKLDSVVSISYEKIGIIEEVTNEPISIIGVGDIMMGTNFPNESYLPPASTNLLSSVENILKNADVTFGNLEGVILNQGGTQKRCSNPNVCYLFRSPEYMVGHLKSSGFDIMSMANNHAGDFGNEGRENTMKVLKEFDISHAGLLQNPYTTFLKNGVKYGFSAFSPNTGTVSINDIKNAKKIVQHLDSICDIVIVSFHGGAEGSKHEHVTRQNEVFYGENRGNVYEFAHSLIDVGADIIFGHGPHVTRALDIYKDRFIIYSLGNFCTYGRFNLRGPNGIAPIIKLWVNKEGEFLKGKIIPITQVGEGIPQIDSEKRVIQKLRELTKLDFPEVNINIDEQGIISYIEP